MKYSKEEFSQLVKNKFNEPFEILEYNGVSKSGTYKCGYCQETYSLGNMGRLLAESRKHICGKCFRSKYASQVLDIIEEESALEFVKFGYSQKLQKPTITYRCLVCLEESTKPYTEFLLHPTCIHCGKNSKRRTSGSLSLMLPEDFTLLSEYNGQYNKSLFRHSCGFIFKMRPKDLISGHSYCPKCSPKASKGERKIIHYLTTNNIQFQKEKVFSWSNNKRYDFFLPEQNLLIEYNGIQHYKEVPTFNRSLEEQQSIDKWKINQAEKYSINILIISYLDFDNIENILAQRLKEIT